MAIIRILNWTRNLCVFFLFINPISCSAGFWYNSFDENPVEDTTSIFEAIEKESLGNVERLIAQGVLLEERNSKGLTPLLYAIGRLNEWGSDKGKLEEIILVLIEQGAFLESADPQRNTPLLKCCAVADEAHALFLAIILLEHGADLEARNQQGATPLVIAAMNGKTDVLKFLIEKKADKEACNNQNQTALMLAVDNNQVKAVEELLVAGAFVDSSDENGMTPLMYASYKGLLAIIQILLQHNADISLTLTSEVVIVSRENSFLSNYKTRNVIPTGSTALTFAEKSGGRGAEKILLEAWVKKDPTMQRALSEWKRKVTKV